jgi:hypothetical protein
MTVNAQITKRAKTTLKAIAGRGISSVLPQCDFSRCVFVLAHMRCGSTALSNILCSRPDISGYGECHVRYDGQGALGRVVLNQARQGAWDRRAPFLFDKILHTRHDAAAPEAFFQARAIFILRDPHETIRSIRKLFATLEPARRAEYDSDEKAARYYLERMTRLEVLWQGFAPARRIGLTHESLLADPERALARISGRLGFRPPLENRYESLAASRKGGGGDPTMSGTLKKIERRVPDASQGMTPLVDLPADLAWQVEAAYRRFKARVEAGQD